MSSDICINLAFEDPLHEAVLRKIFVQLDENFSIGRYFSQGGYGYLKARIKAFNHAARVTPFLVLTDLDKIECAPILINEWLTFPRHPNLLLRVAVREVESWLLAHRSAFSKYLGIDKNKIPVEADAIKDPKQFLINLARRSRYKELREAIVPAIGSSAQQGPDYNRKLAIFVNDYWDMTTAARNSPSLQKMINALVSFHPI